MINEPYVYSKKEAYEFARDYFEKVQCSDGTEKSADWWRVEDIEVGTLNELGVKQYDTLTDIQIMLYKKLKSGKDFSFTISNHTSKGDDDEYDIIWISRLNNNKMLLTYLN